MYQSIRQDNSQQLLHSEKTVFLSHGLGMHVKETGMGPALAFGEGHYEKKHGEIFHGHILQTLGKYGKCPFCFILDHLAYRLICIPPDIQTGIFVQKLMGDHEFKNTVAPLSWKKNLA